MGQTLFDCRLLYIVLGILSLLPILALALPTPSIQISKPHVEKREPNLEGFDGDDNTYGLGIRIGVYLQWVTSAIAYGFIREEAATIRGVNNCFQAAMFAGLLFITITKGPDLYAVEAYIMLIFCMGGVCSGENKTEEGIFEQKKFAYYRASTPGGLIRFCLSAGFCVYGVWFFFTGMDGMQHPPSSTFVYFFAKVNLYNWIRTFMKIVFVVMATIHALIIVWPVIVIFSCRSAAGNSDSTLEEKPKKNSSGAKGLILLSGSLVSFVLTVELMIKWNHINGVNQMGSTGQLLPLIVGIGGFLRVLHAFYQRPPEFED